MMNMGNLSNKGNYEYSEDDARKIFNALEKELKTTKDKFLSVQNIGCFYPTLYYNDLKEVFLYVD